MTDQPTTIEEAMAVLREADVQFSERPNAEREYSISFRGARKGGRRGKSDFRGKWGKKVAEAIAALSQSKACHDECDRTLKFLHHADCPNRPAAPEGEGE